MLYLTNEISKRALSKDDRTIELSFSSEQPYERYFGTEVLDHKPGSIRMDRLKTGAPVLLNHDANNQIGVVEKAWITGGKGRAQIKLSRSQLAEEIRQYIIDGIRKSVSVGYIVHNSKQMESDGSIIHRATDWEPLEISIVSIPADTTVGVGRSATFNSKSTKGKHMTTEALEKKTTTETITPEAIAERERVNEIMVLGRKYDLNEKADECVQNGSSAEAFRKFILNKVSERSMANALGFWDGGDFPNIQRRVGENFSICRAVDSLLSKGRLEGYEAEYNQERERTHKKRGAGMGFHVPSDLTVQKRAMSTATAGAGGNLVQDTVRGDLMIDALRDQLVIRELGATFLRGLDSNVAIPKKNATSTAQWLGETEEVTKSDQTIGQISLSPKRIAAETEFSRTLMATSSPDVESMVRQDLVDSLQVAIDSAIINGTGSSNQPTGILNIGSLAVVPLGANGADPTFAKIVELAGQVADANAARGQLGYLVNTKTRSKLMTVQKFAGTDGDAVFMDSPGDLPGFGRMAGYRAAVSNITPSNLTKGTGTNLSAIIFGNWADVLIGEFGGMYIQVDPYTAHSRSLIQLYVEMLMDLNVRNEESFAAIVDAVTTI